MVNLYNFQFPNYLGNIKPNNIYLAFAALPKDYIYMTISNDIERTILSLGISLYNNSNGRMDISKYLNQKFFDLPDSSKRLIDERIIYALGFAS